MTNESAKAWYRKHKDDPEVKERRRIQAKKDYERKKNDPEFKLKRGRANKKFQELNADYVKKRRQAYQQRPEVKERHRIEEAIRRETMSEQIKQKQRDKYHNDKKHREAMKEYSRYYRSINKNEIKQKDHDRKLRLKLLVFNHYSNGDIKCACCGESEFQFLSLDHINGGGNQHRKNIKKSGINFYSWLIKIGFPEGYQILCMNCNWGKRMNDNICPHNTSF